MAKVSGPLMSMEASGAYAGALVFGKWKGRNVVRQLVTPGNPKSQGQSDNRNAIRVFGAIQKQVGAATKKGAGRSVTDLAALKAGVPSGQAWNGYLVKSGIGVTGATYSAAKTAYAALTAPQKADWDTAAAGLTPAFVAVPQKGANDSAMTAVTAGEVFYQLTSALAAAGIGAAPTAVPPVYA